MMWLYFCLLGVFAGFINGFLGTGGGIVLVFLLDAVWKNREKKQQIFATTLSVTAVYSIISLFIYSKGASFNIKELLPFCIMGAAGGMAGAFFSGKIKLEILKALFAVICIIGGLNMILR